MEASNQSVDDTASAIAGCKGELQQVRDEMAACAQRMRDLKAHEGQLEENIVSLEQKHRNILSMDAAAHAATIKTSVVEKEAKMAALQAQLAELDTERQVAVETLTAVQRRGVVDGRAAGVALESNNINNSRYELEVGDIRTGLSHDPLVQTPGKGHNKFSSRTTEGFAASIDNIGMHVSASPYVRPEDFQVTGERPTTASSSAKFTDWRGQASATARVAQPPGGFSSMSSIFG